MTDNWEDLAEENALKVVGKRDDRWQGEDEDDDIKENWDDEDEEEKSTGSESQVVKPKKKSLAQRIAEKEEKRKREHEEKLRQQNELESTKTPEQILADKLEQQRLQEESDLLLARESFGANNDEQSSNLLRINLVNKEDFDDFKKHLVNKLYDVSKSPHYLPFLEAAIREICVSLEADDIKKMSNSLNALYNEKVKAQKQTTKGKKKKGTSLKMEKNIATEYDEYDDFDEFM